MKLKLNKENIQLLKGVTIELEVIENDEVKIIEHALNLTLGDLIKVDKNNMPKYIKQNILKLGDNYKMTVDNLSSAFMTISEEVEKELVSKKSPSKKVAGNIAGNLI